MWLRWIVSNYVRQAAERKISDLAKQQLHGSSTNSPDRDAEPQEGQLISEKGSLENSESDEGVEEETRRLPRRSEFELAVLFALKIESGGLVDRLEEMVYTRCASYYEYAGLLDDRPVLVGDTGVGVKSARQAAEDVIALAQPRWIVSAGFCGALSEDLRKNQILMADTIVDTEGHELSVGFKMDPQVVEQTPHLKIGRLLTVNELIRTRDEKAALGEKHNAVACDMETFAIAQACQSAGVGFLSVRIVSDGLDDDLPADLAPLLQQKSLAGKLGAATGALFKRPSTVKDLWKLRETALKQSDRLAHFLTGILAQLP